MRTINDVDTERKLEVLLQDVKERSDYKQDFLTSTNNLQFRANRSAEAGFHDRPMIIAEANGGIPTQKLLVNDVCLDQITTDAGLSTKDGRRLSNEYPREYEKLINAIWDKEPKNKLLRTYENHTEYNQARAWLSDKFKVFDHETMVESIYQPLVESDADWEITSGAVTDMRMYMQFKSRRSVAEPAVGDLMALGLNVSNSETGHGSVNISQMIFTLVCLNGMQTGNSLNKVRRPHLGRRNENDGMLAILKADTIEAQNQALRYEIRDVMAHMSDKKTFEEAIERMTTAHGRTIESPANEAVERLGQVLNLTKNETKSVLDGLINTLQQPGYVGSVGVSQATLVNAVTAVQHTVVADEKNNWQKLGGKVLELPRTQWEYIARAA